MCGAGRSWPRRPARGKPRRSGRRLAGFRHRPGEAQTEFRHAAGWAGRATWSGPPGSAGPARRSSARGPNPRRRSLLTGRLLAVLGKCETPGGLLSGTPGSFVITTSRTGGAFPVLLPSTDEATCPWSWPRPGPPPRIRRFRRHFRRGGDLHRGHAVLEHPRRLTTEYLFPPDPALRADPTAVALSHTASNATGEPSTITRNDDVDFGRTLTSRGQ